MFIGTSFGPVVGGVFSDTFGYRMAFVATGALFLGSGLLVAIFVREPSRDMADGGGGSVSFRAAAGEMLRRPELVAAIGLMSIVRFASTAPQPVLPLFIQQMAVDQSTLATQAGVVIAASGTASLVSALAVGHLSDRYGRKLALLVSLLLAAVLSPPHLLVTTVGGLLALRLAMGLALGGLFPAIQALLTDLTPSNRRGMAFGLMATASAIGNGAGPVVGSIVAAGYGVPMVFIAVAPAFVVGAVLVLRMPAGGSTRRT